MATPTTAPAPHRHLASRPTSVHSASSIQASTPMKGGSTTTDGEKHYTHETINQVTKHEQNHGQLKNFSMLSLIGLAYCVLNSWTAMASSLSIVLPSGGPVAMLWGLCVSFVGNLATAASLAEIVHVFPTSGGPYHMSHILAPLSWAPQISWVTGWLACAGWVTLTATTGSLAAALLLGMYGLSHDEFESQPYQTFVIYTGFIVIATFINIYGSRLLPLINSAAIIWSLAGATVILIVCLATSAPNYQSASYVFGTLINETGFPNGIAFILGLLQSSFGLIGIDALSHMVEEIPEPHKNVPRAMIAAICIGAGSSWVLLLALLFVMRDPATAITSTAGSLLATIYQATGNVAGSICLQVFPLVSMEFAAQGILCAASRQVFAFARDEGLPFSGFFGKADPKTGVPVRAVLFVAVWVEIFALIYFGSSAAFNAILSVSVVLLNISYIIPIILLLVRGRHLLRPESFPSPTWTLGPILGPVANVVAVAFTAMTTVFFLFPPEAKPTGSSMNYAVAVMGIVFILSTITWLFQGRKTFTGPRDLGGLLELARAEVNDERVLSRQGTRRRESRSRERTHGHGEGEKTVA
ncbi:hypothetical protein JCM10296v2_004915 [Rhodotorula toruloides]